MEVTGAVLRLDGRPPAGDPGKAVQPRLVSAAHAFEASMMKELLEPLQNDPLFSETADGEAQGSGGTLMSMGSEAMAKALSEHGGLGIARRVIEELTRRRGPAATPAKSSEVS